MLAPAQGLAPLPTQGHHLASPSPQLRVEAAGAENRSVLPRAHCWGAELGLEPTSVVGDGSGCVKIVGPDWRDLLQVPARPLGVRWSGAIY